MREDSLTLYGFGSDDERNVFELLQTASGVGPRLALAMLAVHSPDALRRAVATEDLDALHLVPGIGKKGAQRIVLELKDRLGAPGDGPWRHARAPAAAPPWREQAQSGLVNLGWPARDAEQAVEAVAADLEAEGVPPESADVATVLRAALRMSSARAVSGAGERERPRGPGSGGAGPRPLRARPGEDPTAASSPRWPTRTTAPSRARCGPSG